MARWTLRILICLLLGAVTTVAVAWRAAHLAGGGSFIAWQSVDLAPEDEAKLVDSFARLNQVPSELTSMDGLEQWTLWVQEHHSTWVDLQSFRYDVVPHGADEVRTIFSACFRFVTGFPVRALETDHPFAYEPEVHFAWHEVDRAWPHPPVFVDSWRPIFPGFLINTALYAALWLTLFFGLTATRRTIRRRRGRCPKCGYDLRGDLDNGCSECG